MLGETTYQPFAVNTFSRRGKQFTILTPAHYVAPHKVKPYRRKDGTYVSGSWRDGDGDSRTHRKTGYFRRNPGAVPIVVKK